MVNRAEYIGEWWSRLSVISLMNTIHVTTKHRLLFLMFFFSGACGLLYQVIWVRLAFAAFGVITPVLSIIVSMFMAGLFIGSWAGGKWVESLVRKTKVSAIIFYSLCEFGIGAGAFVVPRLFKIGAISLLSSGEMDSLHYLFLSALVIAFAILPWCILMGATFPLMMAYISETELRQESSFSFLYLANVIGAMCGTLLTALVFVELYGFTHTLRLAALFNFLVALLGILLSRHKTEKEPHQDAAIAVLKENGDNLPSSTQPASDSIWASPVHALYIVVATGFISMAMEVVWTRAFTPVLETTIYAFVALLTTYLCATWIGSYLYRRHLAKQEVWPTRTLLGLLSVCAFMPILLNDPRFVSSAVVVLLSIAPFCAALGYLTPKLIDEYAAGAPEKAGRVYALNILGCIIGPLVAGYMLLPAMGVRYALVLLAFPFMVFLLGEVLAKTHKSKSALLFAVSLILLAITLLFNRSYEDGISNGRQVVHRDYTATVISLGSGMHKRLLVNGIGITIMTPITKMMAHLPLSFMPRKPQSALVICFGMGTTYRSLLSWDIPVTAVELVPSVKDAFGYYFKDAPKVLKNPKGHIVIDDGRRFLNRTVQKFDVITLDPPPPVEAAGSSLLYSQEFYEVVKAHLTDDGIMQQWFPGGERQILRAVTNSLVRSFPYVKIYGSLEGWGYHFLASKKPITAPTINQMLSRMPAKAQADMLEWFSDKRITAKTVAIVALAQERRYKKSIMQDNYTLITDDHPFNEYYFLRRITAKFSAVPPS